MSTEEKETPAADSPTVEIAEVAETESPGTGSPETGSPETESSETESPETESPETEKPPKPEEKQKTRPIPTRSVGVVLSDGKVVEFDPRDHDFSVGDSVVVDNDRDLNLGKVVFQGNNRTKKPLRRVLRRVGPEDLMLIRRNKKREEEALAICQKRVDERKLPMKLIQVAYLHGGNKAIFYFSADGRVDFRALVRDLAQQLHVRIEMRQIGVRDESKMLGGVGICGQQLCCARFLRKFVPVSIKMAKNQNLALNPQKLSGLCGRLMCCLVYEDDLYRKLRKDLPKPGSTIETPRGSGKVLNVDILNGRLLILLEGGPTDMTIEELRGEAPRTPPKEKPKLPEPRPEPRKAEQDKPREGRRRRKRRPKSRQRTGAAGQSKPKPKPASPAQGKAAADGQKQAQDPDGKKKRKRRSRKRSRRRRKKPGEGGSGSGGSPGGSPGAGPSGKS